MELAMMPVAQFAANFAEVPFISSYTQKRKKMTKVIHHFEENEATSGQLSE